MSRPTSDWAALSFISLMYSDRAICQLCNCYCAYIGFLALYLTDRSKYLYTTKTICLSHTYFDAVIMLEYIRELIAALIQRQPIQTPDAFSHYVSAKAQQLLRREQAPATAHFCPRCYRRTLRIVFTLTRNGQSMSVNLRCTHCGQPTVMHMRYRGSDAPAWLKP